MSPRRLWGWEPAEFHEPIVEDGLQVGVRVTRESEFSAQDVALLMAHMRNEGDRGPHGIPMSEAMDPDNQFAFVAAEAPQIDWAEKALGDAKDRYYEQFKDSKRHGHIWRVRRRA